MFFLGPRHRYENDTDEIYVRETHCNGEDYSLLSM
jgi:hypothetical protein